MNQRSKRAWIENVAWTLVVSMSVLQLTSGWQWKAAQAGDSGGKPCWTTANTDPLFERCAGCADAACPGTWIDLISYGRNSHFSPVRGGEAVVSALFSRA